MSRKTYCLAAIFIAVGAPLVLTSVALAAPAGVSNVENFIRSVIQVVARLAGLVATGFFVASGFTYITSSGSPEQFMFDLVDVFASNLVLFADTAGAIKTVRDYVLPTAKILSGIASLACAFFLAHAGYVYMTSSGKPDRMEHAKSIAKKAVIGLVIVLAAVTIVSILNGSYQAVQNPNNASLPSLQAVTPESENNGLIETIIKAVTGLLSSIINAIASPFLNALEFFTKSTPLMASNKAVFNLWLAIVGIADMLLILVVALVGFQVMSASSYGFDGVEVKHLLPRIVLIFLLMNTSIFLIDGIINLSNVLISAVNQASGASTV